MTESNLRDRDRLYRGIGDDTLLAEWRRKLSDAVAFADRHVPLGEAGDEFMRLHRLAEEALARWRATIDPDRLHGRRRDIAAAERARVRKAA